MKSIHLFSTIIDYSILRTIHRLEVFENNSNSLSIQSMSYSNGDVNIAQATVLLNFLKTLNKKEVIKMNPLKNDSRSFYSVKKLILDSELYPKTMCYNHGLMNLIQYILI